MTLSVSLVCIYTSENGALGMHVAGYNNRCNRRYTIYTVNQKNRKKQADDNIISHWSSSSNRAKRRGADRDVI